MAIVFGLIAGLIGAGVWAAIGYFTGYEVGWIAWGIGVACGVAVNAAGDGNNPVKGIIAVAIALASIAVGKYLAIYFMVQKMASDIGVEIEIDFVDALTSTMNPFDILWVILAAGSAYKIGSGATDQANTTEEHAAADESGDSQDLDDKESA